jgi:hypothetical protein
LRSPLYLVFFSNSKKWNENLTTWDECILSLLSFQFF